MIIIILIMRSSSDGNDDNDEYHDNIMQSWFGNHMMITINTTILMISMTWMIDTILLLMILSMIMISNVPASLYQAPHASEEFWRELPCLQATAAEIIGWLLIIIVMMPIMIRMIKLVGDDWNEGDKAPEGRHLGSS